MEGLAIGDAAAGKIDKVTFMELLQQRKEVLYRIAYMYVKNEDDALDIVNDAVCRAYSSIKKLKEPKYFNTWVTRILINCAVDYVKKGRKLLPFHEEIINQTIEDSCDNYIDLYDAVDSLRGKYKTVIILKYFEDLTISQIAVIMECSESNVKNYLHKALCDLRVELRESEF